jgi:3-phenylpropionate/trans-cinnamate dioxygenase ferredoxin subunit
MPPALWTDVAPAAGFQAGGSRLIEVDGRRIAVFNLEGEYFAMEDVCSHDGSPLLGCGLDPRDLIEGGEIVCPHHGARFSIRTGEALTPPAWEPAAIFPVRVDGGMVQVGIPDGNG